MEPLKTLQALDTAIKILNELDNSPIDESVKLQIKQKVVEIVEELSKPEKRTTGISTGSQQKIIESLRKLGGKAIRSQIIDDTGLDPNSVSSLLNKLVKSQKVEKILIERSDNNGNRRGRGLKPDYMYSLIEGNE